MKTIFEKSQITCHHPQPSLLQNRAGMVRLAIGLLGLSGIPTMGSAATADDHWMENTLTNRVSIWDQQYMFGDWGGERSRLAERGVTFDFNNIGDFQADVAGGQTHHAAYFGRFRASADVDFNKLSGFDGEFFISSVWQYGQNLSARYLHVNTLTSSIAGVESERLDQLWYQQGMLKDLLKIKFGQLVAVNDFGATDFFDILYNDELGYAPNTLFATKQPFSPAGKPGVEILTDLSAVTQGLYAKAGIFTAFATPYRPDAYGVAYNDDFQHGWVASGEVGYQEPHTQYSGVYKVGINANNLAVYSNPSTGQNYRGDFTAYGLIEKTVFHPLSSAGKLELNKGLDLLLEALGAPGDRNALEYEVVLGGRYTGLIPGRDKDKIGFGLIYSENGSASSQAYAVAHGHGLSGETTLEIDYQINPVPWFSFQIDNQFIIDPGGDDERSSIDVIGLRTIFRF
jgi:porin